MRTFVERVNNNVDGDFLHLALSENLFEILTFANEFLNCCNRYRNEPLGADKNSLDWWKAKKEEYLRLARLARKYLCVS